MSVVFSVLAFGHIVCLRCVFGPSRFLFSPQKVLVTQRSPDNIG